MSKIENIEKKLFLYALFDSELNRYDMIIQGYNDDASCKYYIDEFYAIYKVLNDNFKDEPLKKKIEILLNRIHNTCIYRIGEFDFSNGSFINDKVQLVNLFDFKFNIESEEKNDVK